MKTERIFAWALIGLAIVPLALAVSVSLSQGFYGIKGVGSFLFTSFFIAMLGWIIGDF